MGAPLPVLAAASTGIRTIGSFLGRKVLQEGGKAIGRAALKGGAKLGTKLGIDTAIGGVKKAGKAVGSIFSDDDKEDTSKKLTPEEKEKQEASKLKQIEKEEAVKSKQLQSQESKQDSKERKEETEAGGPKQKFLPGLEPSSSELAEKEKTLSPVLSLIEDIKVITVIQQNVASIMDSITKDDRRDIKEKNRKAEEKIEKNREDKQMKSKKEESGPGFLGKSKDKILQMGAGGILKAIFRAAIAFFAGKYILEKFFPEFEKPVKEFFGNIRDFFLNIRDSIKALIGGDTETAKQKALDAGANLGNVLKDLAKFFSDLIDKALTFMGFDGFNLYEKTAKFANELKPKIEQFFADTKAYFEGLEGQTITGKIITVISDIVSKLFEKISDLFSFDSLKQLLAFYSDRKEIKERKREELEEFKKGGIGSELRQAESDIIKQSRESGMLDDTELMDQLFTKGTKKSKMRKFVGFAELERRATAGELDAQGMAVYQRIKNQRDSLIRQKEKQIQVEEKQELDMLDKPEFMKKKVETDFQGKKVVAQETRGVTGSQIGNVSSILAATNKTDQQNINRQDIKSVQNNYSIGKTGGGDGRVDINARDPNLGFGVTPESAPGQ